MASCRHVINGALRKLGRLGGGREPRTADAADALAALQGLYLSWIASGAFGRLRDVIAEAALVDRSGGKADLGIPFVPLIRIDVPTYEADSVPPELAAIPPIKPGSRAAA